MIFLVTLNVFLLIMTPIPRAVTTSVAVAVLLFVIFYISIYTCLFTCKYFKPNIWYLLSSLCSSLLMSFLKLYCEKEILHQLNLSSVASAVYHHKSSMSNSDFGELVWENGQIVIKGGQFSKFSRVHNMDSFVNSKTGESEVSSGFDETVSGYDGADAIPWFYHLDDDLLHHESGYGLVAETSGITSSALVQNSRVSSFEARGNDRLLNQETQAAKDPSSKCLGNGPVDKQVSRLSTMLPEVDLKGNQVNDANAQMNPIDANKKISEPIAALPSFCSYSGPRASNNPTNGFKRKHIDDEDCESSSEDTEEESVSIRKTGCKRNRAAEVHNFNERKRREKINEKIRALQELIPNCNKVDKAIMLDEAIDYLRLLQFQVQIMSMRPQMFPSPMMSQTHVQQFMPMGFGMGMVYQPQAALLDGSSGFFAHATCFPDSLNPHPQLWNTAQGLPMSMSQVPGLSVPIHGARMELINPQTSAEYPNSKDPHFT